MKLYIFLYFLYSLVSFSCADPAGKAKPVQDTIAIRSDIKNKPPSSFSDTIKINFSTAVFYNPDSLQLEQIKAIADSAIFDAAMHDCFYQQRNARSVLKQYYPDIKITEIKNARYLLFEKADGATEYVDLNTKNDPCGIFLFDIKKSPKQADMTNIESELGFYFPK